MHYFFTIETTSSSCIEERASVPDHKSRDEWTDGQLVVQSNFLSSTVLHTRSVDHGVPGGVQISNIIPKLVRFRTLTSVVFCRHVFDESLFGKQTWRKEAYAMSL